jgi:hypothetical protein
MIQQKSPCPPGPEAVRQPYRDDLVHQPSINLYHSPITTCEAGLKLRQFGL